MAVPKYIYSSTYFCFLKANFVSGVYCRSLGPLNYLHIWHDNSGPDANASWFLKYIIVRDLQTMNKSHFICQQWLAVEKDDGAVSLYLFLLLLLTNNRNMHFEFSLD